MDSHDRQQRSPEARRIAELRAARFSLPSDQDQNAQRGSDHVTVGVADSATNHKNAEPQLPVADGDESEGEEGINISQLSAVGAEAEDNDSKPSSSSTSSSSMPSSPLVSTEEWKEYSEKISKNTTPIEVGDRKKKSDFLRSPSASPKVEKFLQSQAIGDVDESSLQWLEKSLDEGLIEPAVDFTSRLLLSTNAMFSQLMMGQMQLQNEIMRMQLQQQRKGLMGVAIGGIPPSVQTVQTVQQQEQHQQPVAEPRMGEDPAQQQPANNGANDGNVANANDGNNANANDNDGNNVNVNGNDTALLQTVLKIFLWVRLVIKAMAIFVIFSSRGRRQYGQLITENIKKILQVDGKNENQMLDGAVSALCLLVILSFFLSMFVSTLYLVWLLWGGDGEGGGFAAFLDEFQKMVARERENPGINEREAAAALAQERANEGNVNGGGEAGPPGGGGRGVVEGEAGNALPGVALPPQQPRRQRGFSIGGVVQPEGEGGFFSEIYYFLGGFLFSLYPNWDIIEPQPPVEQGAGAGVPRPLDEVIRDAVGENND